MIDRLSTMLFEYRRWLYLLNALACAAAAWSVHDRLCAAPAHACFHLLTLPPTYVLACLGLLLLYGWKIFIERRTRRPMQLRLVGRDTPGVAVLLAGKHLVIAASAWLAGALIKTGL